MYGSFGMAQATRNMYNQMQILQQQNMMRAELEKKHGKAALARPEAEERSGAKPSLPITLDFTRK